MPRHDPLRLLRKSLREILLLGVLGGILVPYTKTVVMEDLRLGDVIDAVYSADGSLLLVATTTAAEIVELPSGRLRFWRMDDRVWTTVAISDDSSVAAFMSRLERPPWRTVHWNIILVAPGTGEVLREFEASSTGGLALSPDGGLLAEEKWFASSGGEESGVEAAIFIRRIADGRLLHRLDAGDRGIRGFRFSPDGAALVAICPRLGGSGQVIKVWSTASGEVLSILPLRGDHEFLSLAFRPGKDRLDVLSGIWEDIEVVSIPSISAGPEFGPSWTRSISYSQDGRRMVASHGQGLSFWDLSGPQPKIHTHMQRQDDFIFASKAVGPIAADGTVPMVSGWGEILYFDSETGEGIPNKRPSWALQYPVPWAHLGGMAIWTVAWVFGVWFYPPAGMRHLRSREWAALLLPASLVLYVLVTLDVGLRVYRGEIDGSFLPGGTTSMAWALGAGCMLTAGFFLAGLTKKYRVRLVLTLPALLLCIAAAVLSFETMFPPSVW